VSTPATTPPAAAQSLAWNPLHAVDVRRARWPRVTRHPVRRAARFPITHEFRALTLGARRASVSEAAEALVD
jgi:hypothetical protein